MKRIIPIIFGLYILLPVSAQIEDTQVKGSMIYHICNYIIWEGQDSIETFDIGVLGNLPDMTYFLKELSKTKKVHGKEVSVHETKYRSITNDFEALYIAEQYYIDIEEIFKVARKNNILVITSNLENLINTHINFYTDKQTQSIRFVVNKQNLVLSSFDYKDELLLYGGTIVDVKELYQSTQKLLEEEEFKVKKLDLENRKSDSILKVKNRAIDSLTNNIQSSRVVLVQLSDSIMQQSKLIQGQQQNMEKLSDQYTKVNLELDNLQSKQQEQLHDIEQKKIQLQQLDEDIIVREMLIVKKNEVIADKDTIIEARNRTMYLFIGLIGSLLIIGLLIYNAYRTKRKINRVLELKVDNRTKELKSEIERRKQYEEKLIKSERNYREIFNSSTNAIFIHRLDGSIEDVNAFMLKLFGYKKEDIPTLTIADCSSEKDGYTQERAVGLVQRAIQIGEVSFDWLARRKDGTVFWLEVSLKLASIGGEKKVLAIMKDIDEKKKIELELEKYRLSLEKMVDERTLELRKVNEELNQTNEELYNVNENLLEQRGKLQNTIEQLQKTQEQLIEAEKMASVGMLSAGVAHEINNPLNFIKGGNAALSEYFDTNLTDHLPNVQDMLDAINEGVKRSSDIVASLNSFSRRTESMEEDCHVHNIIDNCLVILQSQTKGRINITKRYDKKEIVVKGNGGKLHQVFLNILTNAVQAIENEGAIKIETEVNVKDAKIVIYDSGSGIKPENLSRITEPFFTTKKTGEGTGLGLSISNKIITEHSGNLKILSKVNEGTHVIILLPIFQ